MKTTPTPRTEQAKAELALALKAFLESKSHENLECVLASFAERLERENAALLEALHELAETSWTDTQDGTEDDLVLYRRFVKNTALAAIAAATKGTP